MRIVVDMNLTPDWVSFFATQGIEACHWGGIGDPRASDDLVIAWARDRGWWVFTNDLDFGALLAQAGAHGPSVVQIRTQDVLPAAIGRYVVSILRQYETELRAGALIVVEHAAARIRLLPIRTRPEP
jgi:predicted nuclease of predicted toxin-antitoxin system